MQRIHAQGSVKSGHSSRRGKNWTVKISLYLPKMRSGKKQKNGSAFRELSGSSLSGDGCSSLQKKTRKISVEVHRTGRNEAGNNRLLFRLMGRVVIWLVSGIQEKDTRRHNQERISRAGSSSTSCDSPVSATAASAPMTPFPPASETPNRSAVASATGRDIT